MAKKTPLYDVYARYGGKVIDFGGYLLPVQFSGILAEHQAVRTAAGLFDVSHMGEIEVSGTEASNTLQFLLTNDVGRLEPGQALYSPMCNETGGTVDDVLAYCMGEERYLLVVNAANIEKDFLWVQAHSRGAAVANHSQETAQLALQGPRAAAILAPLTEARVADLKSYTFLQDVSVAGVPCLVSRTGYTGEDGFELYAAADRGSELFEALLEAGQSSGLAPAGLGARDTLRLEARLPLYGHELTDEITPLEAGLGAFVKWNKGDFVGRTALLAQKESGLSRKIVGFELSERGIARAGYDVRAHSRRAGQVTSGSFGPTVQKSIGLALIEVEAGAVGQEIEVNIRDRLVAGEIVKTPFYRRSRLEGSV